ncbi:protein FAR-RED ELONGATED HYPOCOTYL 3-like [Chenopodium quinoa]|uniref:protein FAR-RED ELONGATED HYPOCOTYL 3-like n=1 Tax=Chenopodium quinoa TaxID=63459 RepID=UPI000B76E002|nr:protein FAR-RED ELONGATED HYPOCOTYL 3-like [Chenopodium quinoa]
MSRRRSVFISEALGGDDEPSTPLSQDPIEDFGGDGGYKVSNDEGWQIVLDPDAYGKHNHELIVYEEGNRQMSKLSPGAKQLVRDLTDAKVKPQNILAAVRNQDRLRLKDADGRVVVTYFLELGIESQYTHWILVDPDTNVLTHVFMEHPTSLALLRTYLWVIGIDSTYKTNKYKTPFLELVDVTPCNMNFLIGYAFMKDESALSYAWVIDKLKLLVGSDVLPTAIITNCELGLMSSIREIFPDTAHLLCTCHINNDVEHRVKKITNNKDPGKIFRLTRWNPILNATTLDDYNRAVQKMAESYVAFPAVIHYVKDTWLNNHKEKFVKLWTNGVLHFGNVTNCRVESENSSLKGWLETSTGSLDSVWAKVNKEIEDQVTQIKQSL